MDLAIGGPVSIDNGNAPFWQFDIGVPFGECTLHRNLGALESSVPYSYCKLAHIDLVLTK